MGGRQFLLGLLAIAGLVASGCASLSSEGGQPGGPDAPAFEEPRQVEGADPGVPGVAVVAEGTSLRLAGLPRVQSLQWAPSGGTALIQTDGGFYRLRLETSELAPLREGVNGRQVGWAGPNEALLLRWGSGDTTVGSLSLLTGEWRPLALANRKSGGIALCQGDGYWVWVDIQSVRQGGAASREIGPVHRTPVPDPARGVEPQALGGEQVLAWGALLGQLADGSCLLDGMDQRLLLLRPNGELQTLAVGFALPAVTSDGRGVTWREQAGECPECIELGPGVPFQRLIWWRLNGKRLTADLGSPQRITVQLSPDGERLVIGHMDDGTASGTISVLSPAGLAVGERRSPALLPAGWLGTDLLVQSAAERWRDRSPLQRAGDGNLVGERLASGPDGGMLALINGEVRYLTPGGASYRLASPGSFPTAAQGVVSSYTSAVPYVAVRQEDGVLLVKLEDANRASGE